MAGSPGVRVGLGAADGVRRRRGGRSAEGVAAALRAAHRRAALPRRRSPAAPPRARAARPPRRRGRSTSRGCASPSCTRPRCCGSAAARACRAPPPRRRRWCTGWCPRLLRLVLARLEHVLDALERDRHEARVVAREQVAQRLDAPLLHEVLDLLGRAAGRRVRDRPRRLLLDVELGRREELDERRDDVRLDHRLDLLARPRRDVRDRPARLLADALLRRVAAARAAAAARRS